MNTTQISSTNRCLQCNCFNKTASGIAIALSTILLVGGILALLATTGHNLGPLNPMSQMDIVGSSLAIGFGAGFTLFSLGWVYKMVRQNSAVLRCKGAAPQLVKEIHLQERVNDFAVTKEVIFHASRSGLSKHWLSTGREVVLISDRPIVDIGNALGSNYAVNHVLSPQSDDLLSAIHFGPNPGDKLNIDGATTLAIRDNAVYVGHTDGRIQAYHTTRGVRLTCTENKDDFHHEPILQILPLQQGIFALSSHFLTLRGSDFSETTFCLRNLVNAQCMAESDSGLFIGTQATLIWYPFEAYSQEGISFNVSSPIRSIVINADKVFTGHEGGLITIWDHAGEQIGWISGLSGPVTKMVFHEGKLYASVGQTISVFDLDATSDDKRAG